MSMDVAGLIRAISRSVSTVDRDGRPARMVLGRKRRLDLEMIRRPHPELSIPLEVLVRDYELKEARPGKRSPGRPDQHDIGPPSPWWRIACKSSCGRARRRWRTPARRRREAELRRW